MDPTEAAAEVRHSKYVTAADENALVTAVWGPPVKGRWPAGARYTGPAERAVIDAIVDREIEAAEKRIYDELGHDHFVIFTEDGWTTEHSVECRLSGHMHECAIHSAIGEWANDDPPLPGRWRIVSADGPVPVLERADLPAATGGTGA